MPLLLLFPCILEGWNRQIWVDAQALEAVMRCVQCEEWRYEADVRNNLCQVSDHWEYVAVRKSAWDRIDPVAYAVLLETCVRAKHLLIEVDAVEDEEVKKRPNQKVVNADLGDDSQDDLARCVLSELISSMRVHWTQKFDVGPRIQLTYHEEAEELERSPHDAYLEIGEVRWGNPPDDSEEEDAYRDGEEKRFDYVHLLLFSLGELALDDVELGQSEDILEVQEWVQYRYFENANAQEENPWCELDAFTECK